MIILGGKDDLLGTVGGRTDMSTPLDRERCKGHDKKRTLFFLGYPVPPYTIQRIVTSRQSRQLFKDSLK